MAAVRQASPAVVGGAFASLFAAAFAASHTTSTTTTSTTTTASIPRSSDSRAKSASVSLFSGCTSGFVSCVMFQPLDVLKTRQQTGSVAGMLTLSREIVSQRGVAGLWSGLNPSLCRTVPGVGMYFAVLGKVKSHVVPSAPNGQYSSLQNFVCGAGSRVLVGTFMLPITVVKTRVESGMFSYNGVGSALTTIGRLEGFRGLYSGALATAMRDAPYSGTYLLIYSRVKYAVSDLDLPGVAKHLGSGIVAGSLASLCTQPADVIKTRMQLDPARYPTTWSASLVILRDQGLRGFYAGLAPRIARRTFMTAVSWTIFEEVAPLYRSLFNRIA